MILGSIWESVTSLCMDYNIRKKWVKLLTFSVIQGVVECCYKSLKSQVKIQVSNNPGGKQLNSQYYVSSQSQEMTQSGNLRPAIVYVIARLFRQCQTPQSAQKFLFPKCAVHYLCHLNSNNIIGQSKTTNTEKHFYP